MTKGRERHGRSTSLTCPPIVSAALVWLAFGAAIVIGAWRMDRLEHLQASL